MLPTPAKMKTLSGDLTVIAVLFVPFVTGLAALAATGTVGRVQRNEPELIAVAFFLVLAAGAFWLVSSQISARRGKWVRIGACLAALIGFVVGLSAAISTADDEPRPQITASLSPDARTLKARVSASSMETEDRLNVVITVYTRYGPGKQPAEVVYSAYEGPDSDGNVDLPISTNLPRGSYTDVGIEAFTDLTRRGCDDRSDGDEQERATAEQGKAPASQLQDPPGGGSGSGSGTGCVVLALIPASGKWVIR